MVDFEPASHVSELGGAGKHAGEAFFVWPSFQAPKTSQRGPLQWSRQLRLEVFNRIPRAPSKVPGGRFGWLGGSGKENDGEKRCRCFFETFLRVPKRSPRWFYRIFRCFRNIRNGWQLWIRKPLYNCVGSPWNWPWICSGLIQQPEVFEHVFFLEDDPLSLTTCSSEVNYPKISISWFGMLEQLL